MKNLLIVLLVLVSHLSFAQKVIFKAQTEKCYNSKTDRPKKVAPHDIRYLIVFKSTEVRLNDGLEWADKVYPVWYITSKKNEYTWECKDRFFRLDMKNHLVFVTFKGTDNVAEYTGEFHFPERKD